VFRFDPLCVPTASTIDSQTHCSQNGLCNGMSQMVFYAKFQDAYADHHKMLRLSKDRRFSVLKYARSLASEVCKQTHGYKHVQVVFVVIGYCAVYDVTT